MKYCSVKVLFGEEVLSKVLLALPQICGVCCLQRCCCMP